jgi:hypothetical protein
VPVCRCLCKDNAAAAVPSLRKKCLECTLTWSTGPLYMHRVHPTFIAYPIDAMLVRLAPIARRNRNFHDLPRRPQQEILTITLERLLRESQKTTRSLQQPDTPKKPISACMLVFIHTALIRVGSCFTVLLQWVLRALHKKTQQIRTPGKWRPSQSATESASKLKIVFPQTIN